MNGVISQLIHDGLHDDAFIIAKFLQQLIESPNTSFSKAELSVFNYNLGSIFLYWKSPEYAAHYFDKAKYYMNAANIGESSELFSKVDSPHTSVSSDVTWKLYLCYKDQGKWKECLSQLLSIPAEKRSSAVHLALGETYQQLGDVQSTKASFYQLLRVHPYSLRTARALIHLHNSPEEVWKQMMLSLALLKQTLMNEASSGTNEQTAESSSSSVPLVVNRALLLSQLHLLLETVLTLWQRSPNFTYVTVTLNELQACHNSVTKCGESNAALQCCLGEAYFLQGDYESARHTLLQLHEAHREWVHHMDMLAYLLYRHKCATLTAPTAPQKKKCHKLIKLALHLYEHFPTRVETLIAQGYVNLVSGQHSAVLDCVNALMLRDERNPQLYLLRGQAFLAQEKLQEAISVYAEYRKYQLYNLEILEDLVEAYLRKMMYREALTKLNEAIANLGYSPRLYLLLGNVHMADSSTSPQARACFEQVLKSEPANVDAAVNLAMSYFCVQQDTKAISVLEESLKVRKHYRLYLEMANIYARRRNMTQAMSTMNMALLLEPQNELVAARARELESQISSSNMMFMDEEQNGNWSD